MPYIGSKSTRRAPAPVHDARRPTDRDSIRAATHPLLVQKLTTRPSPVTRYATAALSKHGTDYPHPDPAQPCTAHTCGTLSTPALDAHPTLRPPDTCTPIHNRGTGSRTQHHRHPSTPWRNKALTPPARNIQWIFLISKRKYILWVLIRSASWRNKKNQQLLRCTTRLILACGCT